MPTTTDPAPLAMPAAPRKRCPKSRFSPSTRNGLTWLAAEPFRVFFLSGAAWSIIGVMLWPLLYAGKLGFYPNVVHARIMIEAFGGAFVVGFLGTAGPRMASAPKLVAAELLWLVGLHQACGISHLCQSQSLGDLFFIVMLVSLLAMLVTRVVKFADGPPPPQLLLAVTGLCCGIAGAVLMLTGTVPPGTRAARFADLLLYQGLLLPPLLGIGSFIFPRMLGGTFGEPGSPAAFRTSLARAAVAACLLVASFALEASGRVAAGCGLRALVAAAYLLVEVRWKRTPGAAPRGSLATGLIWALGLGWLGVALVPFRQVQHASVEHLLFIGGFGMLMLIVGSRVLFGHSGNLEGFADRSGWVRFLVLLGVLAATTRATPAWVPTTTVSHHIYAAVTWALLALLWLLWHRKRFVEREDEDG